MTIANTVASKLFVGFVAIAMALSLVAPAKAATEAELQAQIDQLMATINALQAQLGQSPATTGGSSASVCPYAWTRSLSTGATGADVMALQKFLNANPATAVAATGVGSAGMESDYFGGLTAAAVSNFQVMYRDEILTPNGLVNPTGYFGPSTMAKANALCASAPVVDDSSDDATDDDSDDATDDSDDVELQGEAALDTFEIDDADDTDVYEGDEDAVIGVITVEFSDGDAEISRLDLQVLGDGETDTSTIEPWEAFESISLWVDGDKVAEENMDDEDDYLDEDDGTIRFTDLDLVAMEDEELEITVAVSVQNNLDAAELTNWDLTADAIRFFDADGVATTETGAPVTDDTATFTVDEEGAEDEILIRSSSDDPDATVLPLQDDSKTEHTVFVFEIDTDDSTNDIEIEQIVMVASTSVTGGDLNTLVSDVMIEVNGDEQSIDDVTITNAFGATSTITLDFDNEFFIDAGEDVEVAVIFEFKSLALANEGVTVQITDVSATGEGADDLTSTGTTSGDEHTLRTAGLVLEFVEATESDTNANADTAANSYGAFTIVVDATVIGDDPLYIPESAARTAGNQGLTYEIDSGATASTTGQSVAASFVRVSGGSKDGSYWRVDSEETIRLKLNVTSVNPVDGVSGGANYGVQLLGVGYATTNTGTGATYQVATPEYDFDTEEIFINN